jgi:outer membrane immunogenic protein
MNRLVVLCGALLLFAGIASAQDEFPKFEAFGGYSYLRVNPGDDIGGLNFNGGSGSIDYNLTHMLGVVADFGGYHWNGSGDFEGVDATTVTYLFGPKVALRHGPITPFVQALFGGAHISGTLLNDCDSARVRREGVPCDENGSQNAFALTVGGGLDWNATSHIGVRLIQAEYLFTKFNVNVNNSQNNARISAGVVFRF